MTKMFESTQPQKTPTRLTVNFEYDVEKQTPNGSLIKSEYLEIVCSSAEQYELLLKEMNDAIECDKAEEKVLQSSMQISVEGKLNRIDVNQTFSDLESFKKFLEENNLIAKPERTLKPAC